MILTRLKQDPNQPTFFAELQLPPVLPKPAAIAKPVPPPKPKPAPKPRAPRRVDPPKPTAQHQPAAGESWLIKWQGYADKTTPCFVLRYEKDAVWDGPHVTVALREPNGQFGIMYYPVYYLIRKLAEDHAHLADSYYRQQRLSPAQIRHYLGLLKSPLGMPGDDEDDDQGDDEDNPADEEDDVA